MISRPCVEGGFNDELLNEDLSVKRVWIFEHLLLRRKKIAATAKRKGEDKYEFVGMNYHKIIIPGTFLP